MSGFQTRHFFLLSGHVNSKTTFSRETHPLSTVCSFVHSLMCTDGVTISKHGIIGPLWFDDNEHCLTINIDFQVLCKFWTALIWRKEVARVLQWFQQYGSSKESLAWLNQRFSAQLISNKCDPQWSQNSPDLTPPPSGYYLWGYLKDQVYVHNPQSTPDLKR